MKKIKLLTLGLLMVTFVNAQVIFVANNNTGAQTGANVHIGATAFQDAFAASAAGDIIYLVPSPVTYGDLSIIHAITIFGIGIRPDKDMGAKSIIGQINVDADNVRLSGLIEPSGAFLTIRIGWNSPGGNIDGLVIDNCRLNNMRMAVTPDATTSNMIIRNNVFRGLGGAGPLIDLNFTSNTLITNNVFTVGGIDARGIIKALNTVTITYNLFADIKDELPFQDVDNSFIDHNIFYGVRVNIPNTSTGNTWTDNLCFGNTNDSDNIFNTTTSGNSGSGNLESVGGSLNPLFVNFPLTSFWNNTRDFTLQAGSPALNVNGEDIGPSGGAIPFNFEGNVLPLIQSVTVPAVIPFGTNLPVTIKAKGN